MLTLSITIPEEVSQLYHNSEVLKQIIIEAFISSEYEKGNLSIRQGANILGLTYEGFMLDFWGNARFLCPLVAKLNAKLNYNKSGSG